MIQQLDILTLATSLSQGIGKPVPAQITDLFEPEYYYRILEMLFEGDDEIEMIIDTSTISIKSCLRLIIDYLEEKGEVSLGMTPEDIMKGDQEKVRRLLGVLMQLSKEYMEERKKLGGDSPVVGFVVEGVQAPDIKNQLKSGKKNKNVKASKKRKNFGKIQRIETLNNIRSFSKGRKKKKYNKKDQNKENQKEKKLATKTDQKIQSGDQKVIQKKNQKSREKREVEKELQKQVNSQEIRQEQKQEKKVKKKEKKRLEKRPEKIEDNKQEKKFVKKSDQNDKKVAQNKQKRPQSRREQSRKIRTESSRHESKQIVTEPSKPQSRQKRVQQSLKQKLETIKQVSFKEQKKHLKKNEKEQDKKLDNNQSQRIKSGKSMVSRQSRIKTQWLKSSRQKELESKKAISKALLDIAREQSQLRLKPSLSASKRNKCQGNEGLTLSKKYDDFIKKAESQVQQILKKKRLSLGSSSSLSLYEQRYFKAFKHNHIKTMSFQQRSIQLKVRDAASRINMQIKKHNHKVHIERMNRTHRIEKQKRLAKLEAEKRKNAARENRLATQLQLMKEENIKRMKKLHEKQKQKRERTRRQIQESKQRLRNNTITYEVSRSSLEQHAEMVEQDHLMFFFGKRLR